MRCDMDNLLKEMISSDHMTNDTKYNEGLRKLRRYGSMCWDEDVRYYLYCNGMGCWIK